MTHRLRDGLHYCLTDGRVIFFDVPGDRYFGLRPEWDLAFQRLLADDDPGPALMALEEANILIRAEAGFRLLHRPDIAKPFKELGQEHPKPLIADALTCIAAQFKAVALLRFRSFATIIRAIERDTGFQAVSEPVKFGAIRSAFAATAPLRPRNRHCLSNSLAFLYAVRSHGMNATFVMGVSAQPFSAHCWIQSGETVLNDTLENVLAFHPIFSL